MCYITATELKTNLGHYLELSKTEDVYITKNNKVISVLSNADNHKMTIIENMHGEFGSVSADTNYDEILKKEILKRCTY